MASCFLSYSKSYGHLKEPFARLLRALGFEVNIFDEPDASRPPSPIVEERIQNADAVLVLLGPSQKPVSGGQEVIEAAKWPTWEALFAYKRKPLALILHRNTPVPELLRGDQTPPGFDFWDANTFIENIHHIVKHIMDLKKRVELPTGTAPFLVTDCVMRSKIQLSGTLCIESYRKVSARQTVSTFSHGFHTNYDETADVDFTLLKPSAYEVEVVEGNHKHAAAITPASVEKHEFNYFVRVKPPLEAGEEFGYRTRFIVPNFFPVTGSELMTRSKQEGFTQLFPHGFYGDCYTVRSDLNYLILALHISRQVKLNDHKLLVLHAASGEKNETEIKRCNQFLRIRDERDSFDRAIEITIPGPLMNHSYFLLYEPKDE
jgi:hypothetical protein